jgi:phosphoglycolate phosphatase
MFSHFGLEGDDVDAAIVAYRTEYRSVGMYDFTVYDGMAEALRELSGRGERLAVATAKLDRFAIAMLAHAGLEDCFEVIAGVDPEGTRRSKVAVMRQCCSELDWTEYHDVVMIGDRSHDGEGAAELGTPFIGVSWGYGGREELHRAGASSIVDSPAQLVEHLLPRG